jgi:hypothetical protein
MNTNIPQIFGMIGDGLLCLLYIGGIVAGIIGLTRRKILPGILAAVGFLFLGLNLVLNYIISLVIVPAVASSGSSISTYYWLTCLKMPLYLLGAAALVVLVFTIIGKKAEKAPAETPEIPEIPPMP